MQLYQVVKYIPEYLWIYSVGGTPLTGYFGLFGNPLQTARNVQAHVCYALSASYQQALPQIRAQ